MIRSIKIKALFYVILLHLGFAVSIGALFRDGAESLDRTTFGLLILGAILMYGAFVFAVLAIWLPIQPWLARYRNIKAWRRWILEEIPTVLALIPVLISALKILKTAWNEIKDHQAKGELNVGSVATVMQKFATEAKILGQDPAVELAKKRLDQ